MDRSHSPVRTSLLIMSSSGYPPNQGAFSTEQSRYPSHSVQYTFSSTRHQQEFAVPDYCSSRIEVSQASKLLQQQQQEQLLRRPSLLSEFHQGSDRPQERRTEYEQFHTEPSPVDRSKSPKVLVQPSQTWGVKRGKGVWSGQTEFRKIKENLRRLKSDSELFR